MPSQKSQALNWFVIATCVCTFALAGCSDKTVKAANPSPTPPAPTVADSKPITNIAPDTSALPPVANATPPVPNTPPPSTVLPVTPVHTKPVPPPRKPTTEPAAETASEQNSKPAPPQILPQLSAGDQLAYQRQTEDDISVTKQNLRQADGKQLSAAQTDLVQKIQNFLTDSEAASKEGDWSRAQSLSQKARRVSVELIESF
jgi:type IV secretory pathway VirB10-like protein